jgi:hypothetical protein
MRPESWLIRRPGGLRTAAMSYAIVLRFENVSEDQYWAVNEALGIDRDFTQNLPDGLLVHTGGPVDGGGWVVSEVWASKAAQEAFMAERLGAALAAVGVPAPVQVIETETVNFQQPG